MMRKEFVEKLAEAMTNSADLSTLEEQYYFTMETFLKSLSDEDLIQEYEDWFEPQEPIKLEEDND